MLFGVIHTFLLLLLLPPHISTAQSVISLDGDDWTLSNPLKDITVPAKIPGQVHLDLHRAEVIGDPLYGSNEINLRWVANDTWIYSSLQLSAILNSSRALTTFLIFDGLDTFATIQVCGKIVGKTNNQFKQYTYDISTIFQNCNTTSNIEVSFQPATQAAVDAAFAAANGSCANLGCIGINTEFPGILYLRKQQLDFGWDFAPGFSPAGIWKSARLVQLLKPAIHVQSTSVDAYRQGQINNLPPDQSQPWIVNASLEYIGSLPTDASVQLKIYNTTSSLQVALLSPAVFKSNNTSSGRIARSVQLLEEPNLWWPVGYGNQSIYSIDIVIKNAQNATIASVTKEIGFRTIVLNQQPITPAETALGIAPGNRWNFEINGHEIYCKGSNFVPPDPFWPRVTTEEIRDLFESVVDANMNMLRIWGGAAYLPEWILAIADEMGIMLWLEFEFSDASYPTDSDFLANVRTEADYQVRLANSHPSVALWSGGNEIEAVLVDTLIEEGLSDNIPVMAHYETIFNVLLRTVFDNSRSLSFIPSSVTNGYLQYNYSSPTPIIERYLNGTPGEIYGSTDYYNYTTGSAFDTSYYPVGRFSVEFGFQSMPSLHTWSSYIPHNSLYFNSTSILLHNHHYPFNTSNPLNPDAGNQTLLSLGGMGQMALAAQQFYPIPPFNDSSVANFTSWIYTTQIFQAEFIRAQANYYRIGSGKKERQLGTLYWQLNDIWAAPTWAGIEKGGKWKMLHYAAKEFFNPVIIAEQFNASEAKLEVWVVSDLWVGVEGTARIEWFDWSGKMLNSTTVEVHVGAVNATSVWVADLTDTTFDLDNAVARLSVSVQTSSSALPSGNYTNANSNMNKSNQTYTHETWFSPHPLKDQKMLDPGLSLRFDNQTKEFVVKAEKGVAAFVWLDVDGDLPKGVEGRFEVNGFWLGGGEEKSVRFVSKGSGVKKVGRENGQGEQNWNWVDRVKVRSLWDNLV